MTSNNSNIQFNNYKYTELSHQYEKLCTSTSSFQLKLGLSVLEEWCWTYSRDVLIDQWLQQYKQPNSSSIFLSVLHFNIRYFYSNRYELIDMIDKYTPSVICLNELGAITPQRVLEKLMFSYNVFIKEGTNTHGGAVIAIDKKIKAVPIDIPQANIVAVTLNNGHKTYTIVSVYSPPHEPLPIATLSMLKSTSKNIIIVGDFNSKHVNWECPDPNTKGYVLAKWLDENDDLSVHNAGMITSLRSNTTIDLVMSTEPENNVQCRALPYKCSDHYPVLVDFSNIELQKTNSYVPKTYWNVYQTILSIICNEIEQESGKSTADSFRWFEKFQKLLNALKHRVTIWHKGCRIRPTLSPSLRLLIKHKHYLQNRYRHSRLEVDRLRLRSWEKVLQREFQQFKAENWNKFISQVASPNPVTFWKTIKILNKKKSTQFSAITKNNNTILKSTQEIIEHLYDHFSARFAPPTTDANNITDREAQEVWNRLSQVDSNSIYRAWCQSDLKFDPGDVKKVITNMKIKNSAGFDLVSNKMVKILPQNYMKVLADSFNKLFEKAYWGESWKQARTVCFNKSNSPAPSTSQLRPISLLPIFGKIYERLFLLKFNLWVKNMNILPWQQSGARPHLHTMTRVNHLLENITESLAVNTFTPVIYIDFLQAFDMLWHQGIIYKLYNLCCPDVYLYWLINYFTNRSLIIDYDGCCSATINISRGAPQGSVLGPIAYIIAHYDLPKIFERPENVHIYVDDLAIAYVPSLYLSHRKQIEDIERIMNHDLEKLLHYTVKWHQPVNVNKTEYVIYHRMVQSPNLKIGYNGTPIIKQSSYKYLGVRLDAKLAFHRLLDDQFIKLRRTYAIMKFIHQQFPSYFKLKERFFSTYIWPHIYLLSTIYCLMSFTAKQRIDGFYRRCLRIIYCLYQCSTADLHDEFRLPTLTSRYKKCLLNRVKSIQLYEPDLISCYLLRKKVINIMASHYTEKACIPGLQKGRPNKKIIAMYNNEDTNTFLDHLLNFIFV